jgi:integrase
VEAPQFVAGLSSAAGTAAKALRFLIFTVGRTNEVLGARWSEIDSTRAIWRIPGERMKMGENHSVPLSDAALAVLDEMRDGSQSDLIFPNDNDEHFSDMAMLAVLKRMDYGHVTVHGFRATFATWAEECTDYPDGVREAALAHKYKNETMAAYQRGEKLENTPWSTPPSSRSIAMDRAQKGDAKPGDQSFEGRHDHQNPGPH